MLNVLNPATDCTLIIIDIAPSLEGISYANSAMKNQPKQIILFVFMQLQAGLTPDRGPLVNGTDEYGIPETGTPRRISQHTKQKTVNVLTGEIIR